MENKKMTIEESAIDLAKLARLMRNTLQPFDLTVHGRARKHWATRLKDSLLGIPPWKTIAKPVLFEIGRVFFGQELLAALPPPEIIYYLDAHRRCQSGIPETATHRQWAASLGRTVFSVFDTDGGYKPRFCKEFGYQRLFIVVVTNRPRTRTIIRLWNEGLTAHRVPAFFQQPFKEIDQCSRD